MRVYQATLILTLFLGGFLFSSQSKAADILFFETTIGGQYRPSYEDRCLLDSSFFKVLKEQNIKKVTAKKDGGFYEYTIDSLGHPIRQVSYTYVGRKIGGEKKKWIYRTVSRKYATSNMIVAVVDSLFSLNKIELIESTYDSLGRYTSSLLKWRYEIDSSKQSTETVFHNYHKAKDYKSAVILISGKDSVWVNNKNQVILSKTKQGNDSLVSVVRGNDSIVCCWHKGSRNLDYYTKSIEVWSGGQLLSKKYRRPKMFSHFKKKRKPWDELKGSRINTIDYTYNEQGCLVMISGVYGITRLTGRDEFNTFIKYNEKGLPSEYTTERSHEKVSSIFFYYE